VEPVGLGWYLEVYLSGFLMRDLEELCSFLKSTADQLKDVEGVVSFDGVAQGIEIEVDGSLGAVLGVPQLYFYRGWERLGQSRLLVHIGEVVFCGGFVAGLCGDQWEAEVEEGLHCVESLVKFGVLLVDGGIGFAQFGGNFKDWFL
jgi:hypothetical protein